MKNMQQNPLEMLVSDMSPGYGSDPELLRVVLCVRSEIREDGIPTQVLTYLHQYGRARPNRGCFGFFIFEPRDESALRQVQEDYEAGKLPEVCSVELDERLVEYC